jgi:4-hydroxymandelate oxidase
MVASTTSNRSIEKIMQAATRSVWFQLYIEDDRERTRELIQRAEGAGCKALCITVDLPYTYARNREGHILADAPQFPFPNLGFTGGPGASGRKGRSRRFTWNDLDWIRSIAKTPILLKGVLNPDDADLAVKAGAAGIIVSNHGGRALDSVPATIEALPRVTERIAGRILVLTDGGIRRGTDVLKALGLEASAVLVGRPYLYGLAVEGSAGVQDVIQILRDELRAAMGLCGITSIAAISHSVLWQGP